MTFTKSVILAVSILVVGCTTASENELLRFPVETVRDVAQAEMLSPERVMADSLEIMGFAVFGDRLVTTTGFGTDHALEVVDMTTGDVVNKLCRVGRGPGEFLGVLPHFTTADEAVVVYDSFNGTISEVYAVGEHAGDIARQVKLEAQPGKPFPLVSEIFKLNEKEILGYNSIQSLPGSVNTDNPYYAVFDYETGAEKRAFELFDAAPLARVSEFTRMFAFDLCDCMNSERTTLCFAMGKMPVFAFLDIPSGKVRGFRLSGEPDFSTDENNNRVFFTGVSAREQSIYALYQTPGYVKTILYKFDWKGKVQKKYELDSYYMSCFAAPESLYLTRAAEDNMHLSLYRLDYKDL